MKFSYVLLVAMFAGAIGIAACAATRSETRDMNAPVTALPFDGRMPSLKHANTWINSEPLSDSSLRGKVVLIDFWTYTCINWRRQLPYIRAWSEKYREKGLVVIGVHTPEFEFEKDVENVRWAVKAMNLNYPVVIDSDYSIWGDFNNQYWPALYFVDSDGNIRHKQFGEGEYDRSERVIQALLKEAGAVGIDTSLVKVSGEGIEAAADWDHLRSPENYTGYARTANFASPGGLLRDSRATYSLPSKSRLNDWALAGSWKIDKSAARLYESPGRIAYRFHSRDLNVVMGAVKGTSSIRFRVLLDGRPPGAWRGVDIDEQGNGVVSGQRLYQIVRHTGPITDQQIEIEFLDPGVEIYAFTFG